MNKEKLSVNCPTCGKKVEWTKAFQWKPFCSERCKLIDLGDWAEGNNRIPGKPETPDLDTENHH
jgi:hypothetical protein